MNTPLLIYVISNEGTKAIQMPFHKPCFIKLLLKNFFVAVTNTEFHYYQFLGVKISRKESYRNIDSP